MSAGMASQTHGSGHTSVTDGKCVAGIDVGGERKGFHLVVLRDNQIVCSTRSLSPEIIAERCVELGVVAVGVDAPCQWGQAGQGAWPRSNFRRKGFFASQHRLGRWQLGTTSMAGCSMASVCTTPYQQPTYCSREYARPKEKFICSPAPSRCGLDGCGVARKAKAASALPRQQHQIDLRLLRSIDAIDAGLCALTAGYVLAGKAYQYGDKAGGYLLVPNV